MKEPEPSHLRRWTSKLGGWNWAAIASLIAAVAASAGVLYTGKSLNATQAQNEVAAQSQAADRFTTAVDQLDRAGPEHLQARLGAIYAMERLARDSPADHPTIIEVLTAFIRTTTPEVDPNAWADTCTIPRTPPDIQAALTVLGRRNTNHDRPTDTINLRFTCLPAVDLAGADLGKADLTGADLHGADLTAANLTGANLNAANISFGTLKEAKLLRVGGADLTFADLTRADMRSAAMDFSKFDNANLVGANLTNANLYGADLSQAIIAHANFTYTRLQHANLTDAVHDDNTVMTAPVVDDQTRGVWWK